MAHFIIPSHVFAGENALSEAAEILKKQGKKALIVTGKHVGKSPMCSELKSTLSDIEIEYEVFDGITGEPTTDMIDEGLKVYQEKACDFVIGIGGGSPLDSAKAIAAMAVNKGSIADFIGKEIGGDVPGIVAIPTTSGTGSEATKFTIITDPKTDIKMLLKGDALIPKVAILKPEYTVDMPKSVTSATGMDALTHAVEAYTSRKASKLTDVFAISAVKRILKYLPIAYEHGYDARAREEMLLAAYEAGICINNSSVTIVHGMSRPIGALFHVPHGMSNAMLIKDCLTFAMDGGYERFGSLSKEAGVADKNVSDEEASKLLIKEIGELTKKLSIPTLKEYGVDEAKFMEVTEKMATDAINSGSPGNTLKTVTKEDCIAIYKKAYNG